MFTYISIITISFILVSLSTKKNSIPLYLGIGIMILFAGFRYNVGIDFVSYWENILGSDVSTSELGHKYLSLLCTTCLGFGPQIIFLLYASFTIISVCWFYKSFNLNYYSICCFLLFASDYFNIINIMRQYVALSFFLFSIKYLLNRCFCKYLIYLILGSLFHYSLILLIPFYWLLHKEMSKRMMLFILFFSALSSSIIPINTLFANIPIYGAYLDSFIDINKNAGLGFGFLCRFLILLLIILLKDKILRRFENALIIVNSIFYGIVICLIFSNYIVFLRLAYYFQIFFPLAVLLIINCFHRQSRIFIIFIFIVYGYLLLFSSLGAPNLIPYDYNFDVFDASVISR